MLNIILLAGENGIGKSTTSLELVKYYNFIQYSFGTAPKAELSELKGYDYMKWLDRDFKEEHRTELITYAEGAKKERGEDVWAKIIADKIESYTKIKLKEVAEVNVVIDDYRFDIEYQTMKQLKKQLNEENVVVNIIVVEIGVNDFEITPNSILWLHENRLQLTISKKYKSEYERKTKINKQIGLIISAFDKIKAKQPDDGGVVFEF